MQTDPSQTDGRSAIASPLLECLNLTGTPTYQRYGYLSDSIDREAIEKEHADADGSPLGSDTREGFEKGAINLQCNLATAKIARPGHIIRLDIGSGWEYYIAGKFGRARTRNEIIRGSLQVKKAYNPIVTSLLSEEFGQRKSLTQAAGALSGSLAAAPTVVNTRTGATLAWSMAARPGYTLPVWLSINSSTGALSGTAAAGTWEIDIICTDTLATQEDRVGFGILEMIIT